MSFLLKVKSAEITTTGRVPLFIDNDKVIWDSMLICEYLLQKQGKEISLEQKLKLVEINEASDSAITLFQLKKFNLDNSWSNEFSQLQLQRIDRVLADFDKTYRSPKWEIQDMWLYCFLDWLDFRQVFSWREKFKNLVGFMNAHKDKFILQQTDPRG